MMIIEKVETVDFVRLFEIEQRAHSVPWTKGMLLNNQGERYLNLKLSIDNHIVAFLICQWVLDEATLFNIAVDPDYQSRGIGRYLLNHLLTELKRRGVMTCWLEVRKSNNVAQQLYHSMGFNLVTQRKNYYPTVNNGREDALIMALAL